MFFMQSRLFFAFSLAALIIVSATIGAPRQDQALIDITYEAIRLAQQDNQLERLVTPVVGETTIKLNGAQLKRAISTLSRQTLEQVRNTLNDTQRRQLIGLTLREFITPSAENDKYGTVYYARKFDEICKGDEQFYKNHKDFCGILNANAQTTSSIKLGMSLKQAYEKVNNTAKAVLKPELTRLGQLGYMGALKLLNRRISNNKL